VSEVDHNGRPVRVHSWDYTLRIFFCFAVWTFLINLTAGVFTQILNPVLVNRFGLQFAALSLVTTLHKVCSLLASLCAIPLAKHGRDSALIIVGVGLILAGILLFCWVPMHVSLVIAGSALVEQGTTFSLAMSVALMSKMLGRRAQGWAFGVFSSVLMLGKGVSTVVGGWVLQGTTIGTWSLALWGLPAFVVLLMLVHPNTQRFLDPERPLVKRMTHPEPPAASGAAGEEEVIVEITPDRGCAVM
jgi:cyanate permease